MKETRTHLTKSSLSPNQIRLLELMQRINFGRIEGLTVKNGEPVFDPPPQAVRDVKFGAAKNDPRPELNFDDFLLKAQVTNLFSQFDALRDATIDRLDIKHGLPFRMSVRESVGE